MKTILFSDTHLSDHFDQQFCDYTSRLILSVDRIIIAGDFWDGYLTSFDRFLSTWQPLLAALSQREVVYLYGNHDLKKWSDERIFTFATQAQDHYELKVGKYIFHIEHGHRLSAGFDERHSWATNLFKWLFPRVIQLSTQDSLLGKGIRRYLLNLSQRKHQEQLAWAKKKYGTKKSDSTHVFVTGNSHIASDRVEDHYLNPGEFQQGWARYILIENSTYQLVEERYA